MFQNSNWENEGFPRHVAVYVVDVYKTVLKFLIFYSMGIGLCFSIDSKYLNIISSFSVFGCLFSMLFAITSEEGKFWSNLTSLLLGILTGPMFIVTFLIDPSIIINSLGATMVLFFCFTYCAYNIKIKKMFYLASWLSSALSILILLYVSNILIFKSFEIYLFHIYFSILLFSFYLLYDTRIMIEKAHKYIDYEENKKKYESEVILDSMNIFLDIINIFIKLISHLLGDKKKRKKN